MEDGYIECEAVCRSAGDEGQRYEQRADKTLHRALRLLAEVYDWRVLGALRRLVVVLVLEAEHACHEGSRYGAGGLVVVLGRPHGAATSDCDTVLGAGKLILQRAEVL